MSYQHPINSQRKEWSQPCKYYLTTADEQQEQRSEPEGHARGALEDFVIEQPARCELVVQRKRHSDPGAG